MSCASGGGLVPSFPHMQAQRATLLGVLGVLYCINTKANNLADGY